MLVSFDRPIRLNIHKCQWNNPLLYVNGIDPYGVSLQFDQDPRCSSKLNQLYTKTKHNILIIPLFIHTFLETLKIAKQFLNNILFRISL